MNTSGCKVLVIGLDGATFDLIKPWIGQGKLPNLARLMREGVHAPLQTVPTRNSGPAWSSIITGVNPGKHGVFHLASRVPGSYEMRPTRAADRRVPAIWDWLSVLGKQVVVVNVPVTYPASPVNGCMVAGSDAPGPWSPGFTHPPGLIEEIEREVGRYYLWNGTPRREGRQPLRALEEIHRTLDCHIQTVLYLLQTRPWDLGFVVFTATDIVQHIFWAHDWEPGPPSQQAIFSVYGKLDSAIGRCLALSGDDATVIILSDHGAGPGQPGHYLVDEFLVELGLLRRSRYNTRHRALRHMFLAGRRWLGEPVKLKLMQRFPGLYRRVRSELGIGGIDWAATRAFSRGLGRFVWLNVLGRDPQGIVEPGAEYEALQTWLREVLLSVRDPATGEPAFRAVHRGEDLYEGPFRDQAADLVLIWSDMPLNGLHCEVEGRVITVDKTRGDRLYVMTGGHRDLGILVARGPGIQPGVELPVCHLYDITPTLLYLFGQPVPRDMDGRVLTEMFEETYRRPVEFTDQLVTVSAMSAVDTSHPHQEEMEIVKNRLRALGYLD